MTNAIQDTYENVKVIASQIEDLEGSQSDKDEFLAECKAYLKANAPTTARLSDYRIVEIVKQTAKTSIVREITEYSDKTFRVKNSALLKDEFIPLNTETAKTATLVVSINNPEWGVKRFHYKGQPLTHGEYTHIVGTGSNGNCVCDGSLKYWRVVR